MRAVILRVSRAAGLAPLPVSNPREVRAIASTLALHGNCSILTIMGGCFSRLDTVFANHYIRDFSTQDVAGIQEFGPQVDAQQ